jgi:predicted nuclease of predicted toxin-antitoxin system
MKIKLDENMPLRLAEVLRRLGHDTDTVPKEGLAGRCDEAVWHAAQESGRFLITQDLDFSDTRRFAPGTRQGILLVRLREPGRNALLRHVEAAFLASS